MPFPITVLSDAKVLHDTVVDLFVGVSFPKMSYRCDLDGDGNEDNPLIAKFGLIEDSSSPGNAEEVEPIGIKVVEQQQDYQRVSGNTRSWPPKSQVSQWVLEVQVEFPCLVDLSYYTAVLASSPPVVERTHDANGNVVTNQYILDLTRVRSKPQRRGDSHYGTISSFTFRADPGRVV